MRNKATLFVCLLFLCAPALVLAEAIDSTTSTYVSSRDCVAGKTACDSITRSHNRKAGGVAGGNEAEAILNDAVLGEVQAKAALMDEPDTGKLSGYAKSLAGKRNAANAFLIERFTNNSETAQTFTVAAEVRYELEVPEDNADFPAEGGGLTTVGAEISLFRRDGLFEAGPSPEENWAIMDGGMPPGFKSLGEARKESAPQNVTADGSEPLSLSTRVEPGDSVWVFAILQTISSNGGEATGGIEARFEFAEE